MGPMRRNLNRVFLGLGDLMSGRYSIPDPSPLVGGPPQDSPFGVGVDTPYGSWFGACRVPLERVREMEYYDLLEQEISDVPRALDAYATMAVTGNLAGGGSSTFTIRMTDKTVTYPEALKARLKRMEQVISGAAFETIRTMCKYGSYMPELTLGNTPHGHGVMGLRPIPPGTIFRNFDERGNVDLTKYWMQDISTAGRGSSWMNHGMTRPAGNKNPTFPMWQLPHFAIWSNVVSATETLVYGQSILKPFGPIGLKVAGTLDSMVLARLTRAAMRYAWSIDVSDIAKDPIQIMKRVKQWKTFMTRATTSVGQSGAQDGYRKPPTPDEDFFVPAAEGLGWKIDTIDGDTNLARVNDVELLFRVYFGALGMPPEYLGHERSQGGRSNLSQIDINFARTTRHIQLYGASGFQHMVWIDMLAGGFDPQQFPVECVPPQIGARDELLQAQIRHLQATVLASLRKAGMKLETNPRWVLTTFLGMGEELEGLTEEEINNIFDAMEMPEDSDSPGASSADVEAALRPLYDQIGDLITANLRALTSEQYNPIAAAIARSHLDVDDIIRSRG